MPRILLVKTSSLGDVVHNLPVASDIAAAVADAEIDWVVEESFVALPRLHPRVARVLPVALRRWRRQLTRRETWVEVRAFTRELRAREYDAIVDTQGLFKSAVVARAARGRRFGLDWRSSREPLFAFYDRTFDIPRTLHAVERNRLLASHVLGYAPAPHVDYGIRAQPAAFDWLDGEPHATLLHATSARTKLWPEAHWVALGRALALDGLRCVLPWGSREERARSDRLAAEIPRALVTPRMALAELCRLLGAARCAVGVDTGLCHLSGALGVPTVGVYVATEPSATGLHGCARAVNLGGAGRVPGVEAVLAALKQVRA